MSEDTVVKDLDIFAPQVSDSDEGVTQDVLETINLHDGSAILRLPDKDNRPIYFPSYDISAEELYGAIPGREQILKDVARTDVVVRNKLTETQSGRLKYALTELKLPTILAVHAALNTDVDLESYQKPDRDAPNPVTFAMLGRPGVGKSFMTALLSFREGIPIINLDSYSGISSFRYLQLFEQEFGSEGRGLSVEKAWKVASSVPQAEDKAQSQTLRSSLDEALQNILASTSRPEMYLVDMPGIPGRFNFGTGRVHGKLRPLDLFDLVARESCESGVVSTHQLTVEPVFGDIEPHMEKKLRWIKNEVIAKNFPSWQERRRGFVKAVSG